MKVLSHRGYWKSHVEKNAPLAFERSFSLGYGTETDIRDFNQSLVISHDIANGSEIKFLDFLQMANLYKTETPLTLALNIKADGLAFLVRQYLDMYPNLDCFVFDMSVPDMRSYFEVGVPVFVRMSEVEKVPVWIDLAAGVWLDAFESEWYDVTTIQALLQKGKKVCIVSPELHKRAHLPFWESIKSCSCEQNLMLCTDFPEEATIFFEKF